MYVNLCVARTTALLNTKETRAGASKEVERGDAVDDVVVDDDDDDDVIIPTLAAVNSSTPTLAVPFPPLFRTLSACLATLHSHCACTSVRLTSLMHALLK